MGTVKERVFTFLPKFELYEGPQYIAASARNFVLKPCYNVEFNGWENPGKFYGVGLYDRDVRWAESA